ncbi:MAG: bifunctional adenosylcobinamide kinase/adenosylcobinamide-phosphate guanylyltransferase [Synergistaceae bacterium]|jgi:adenosyl cobinamide kinase/adenosyl cobinamide phosphate guanylyltransferase|nr:bifunctional adenosylcobinamide kinase/adenosylcobinamide-phosphate guanylyltransferase [Synergistaceae bacterium]
MHLIVGGKYMGKLRYAQSLYGRDAAVCDLTAARPEDMFEARIVVNLQEGVRHMLEREQSVRDFFESNILRLEDKVLIGDEIGSGIVPADPFERLWRDETGFLYQMLAARAARVDRVWAGLPCPLKG